MLQSMKTCVVLATTTDRRNNRMSDNLLNKLTQLKLPAMAGSLIRQRETPQTYDELSFEERLTLLVDDELLSRENSRVARLRKNACLKYQATPEGLRYPASRGLRAEQMRELLNGHYIIHRKNLLITGPTGCGKSWIANALGEQACRQKYSVRYCRTGRLLEQLAQGRVDGSWLKYLKQLQKIQVLIFFYEEHAQKSTDQSLVLCDTVRYLPESFEIPWNPNTRTEVSTFCISQFRYSAQIRPSSVVTKDYTFKRPGWAGRFDQEGQYQDYQRTQYEVYDYPGRFKGAHGQNFARWQMDGWRNNAEVARGTSRSPEIWPGRRIVLTGHPQANLNREWQVVASELHGEQPQAVPGRSGSGTTLNNHFAVIPADRTWRPQPLLKPLVDGPQSAVVTGPAGEEIFCDEHGRVRVKFNWDRYNPSNQDSSCWIRVAQAWAGTGFGNLAIPRVGQEVIVDFLNGDPDQPIIMGRTYHQENRTPGSLPGTKTQMTIRSKTYKGSGFNELKFDDATGKEQVYIHVQKNMNTEVLNNRTTDVINNHAEKIGNNQAITVTNNQMQNGI
ncbi:hypothetical protein BWR58_24930 [Shigella sonnei]|nr:hypothetical protein BWR58_24930 [Shigella sonnei]